MNNTALNTLSNALQSLLRRFIDTSKATSSTNITTALGTALMSAGVYLLSQPVPEMMYAGTAIGIVGFGISLYKKPQVV